MSGSDSKKLKKFKEYVKKRLAELTPVFQKATMGDFSGKIEISEKEDEFSELLVGLSLMMDDLRELDEVRKKSEKEKMERLVELERWRKLTTGRELKMVELKREIKRLKEELEERKK